MSTATILLIDHTDTPLGPFTLIADTAGRLRATGWHDVRTNGRMARQLLAHENDPRVTLTPATDPGGLTTAIRAYFDGDLSAIADLPLADAIGTPFQRAVWRALRDIPCGQTRSYGELARQIGRPAAVRAVGLANGANPVGVVVPCHRVIGSTGALVGYGGGLDRKRWLLAHERRAGVALELPFAAPAPGSRTSLTAPRRWLNK
jgi:methylated-DNA-[protein]-cysteine S-methyltransferase